MDAAILRGTAQGLDFVVQASATPDAIADALTARLGEAPTFWKGSDVRVRVENGQLPAGCLAKLDAIAGEFDLRLVEVTAVKPPRAAKVGFSAPTIDAVPQPETFAAGSAPAEAAAPAAPAMSDAAVQAAAALVAADDDLVDLPAEQTRVVVGPVRSGVILDHVGHVIVFGDVNPGAEVRAAGNIVVLGRLRGTAHAGIGRDAAFILALRLEPQQLRICRLVARADDGAAKTTEPELAHVASDAIVVERYAGRLPGNLASSI
ncbi:MAG TPA: septum site-determining protein MinC [Kofleriaceae bacterium]